MAKDPGEGHPGNKWKGRGTSYCIHEPLEMQGEVRVLSKGQEESRSGERRPTCAYSTCPRPRESPLAFLKLLLRRTQGTKDRFLSQYNFLFVVNSFEIYYRLE